MSDDNHCGWADKEDLVIHNFKLTQHYVSELINVFEAWSHHATTTSWMLKPSWGQHWCALESSSSTVHNNTTPAWKKREKTQTILLKYRNFLSKPARCSILHFTSSNSWVLVLENIVLIIRYQGLKRRISQTITVSGSGCWRFNSPVS